MGNRQSAFKIETETPGLAEAESLWKEYIAGEEYEYSNNQI